jgi:hypothetical protein
VPRNLAFALVAALVLGIGTAMSSNVVDRTSGLLGAAALTAAWSGLAWSRCASCDRARQLSGGLPLAAAGAVGYASLAVASGAGVVPALVANVTLAAAGSHASLLAILLRARAWCAVCLITAGLIFGAAIGAFPLVPTSVAIAAIVAGAATTMMIVSLSARAHLATTEQRTVRNVLTASCELPCDGPRVVVWSRPGCPPCQLFARVVEPGLSALPDTTIDRRAAEPGMITPTVLVCTRSRRICFVGIDPRTALRRIVPVLANSDGDSPARHLDVRLELAA